MAYVREEFVKINVHLLMITEFDRPPDIGVPMTEETHSRECTQGGLLNKRKKKEVCVKYD